MPGACLSLWPTEDCGWSTWDIWRSSEVVECAIYLGLALMLAYTFFVRFLRRCLLAFPKSRKFQPESSPDFLARKRTLAADLSRGLGILSGIG